MIEDKVESHESEDSTEEEHHQEAEEHSNGQHQPEESSDDAPEEKQDEIEEQVDVEDEVVSPPETIDLSLEERVQRLEDALASLQSGSPPSASEQKNEQTDKSDQRNLIQRVLGTGKKSLPTVSTMKPPSAHLDAVQGQTGPQSFRWLPLEMLSEFRAMIRMYLDFRYSLSWTTRVMVPSLIVALILNWWIVGSIVLVGWLVSKVMEIVLLYALFKVLSREATRYRQTSPDIPPSLRL